MAKSNPPPPPYSAMAPTEIQSIPLDDLEAGLQRSANKAVYRFHHKNNRRIIDCGNSCSCTGCNAMLFLPGACDTSWRCTAALFGILVTMTLIFWVLSKA